MGTLGPPLRVSTQLQMVKGRDASVLEHDSNEQASCSMQTAALQATAVDIAWACVTDAFKLYMFCDNQWHMLPQHSNCK